MHLFSILPLLRLNAAYACNLRHPVGILPKPVHYHLTYARVHEENAFT